MLLASEPLFDAIKLAGAAYFPSSVMGVFRQGLLSDLAIRR
jgi:hypothetical protein